MKKKIEGVPKCCLGSKGVDGLRGETRESLETTRGNVGSSSSCGGWGRSGRAKFGHHFNIDPPAYTPPVTTSLPATLFKFQAYAQQKP